ncbi:ARM repeat-containing protein [Coemansia reversa NRRL 1564]|uniref:ARM repeat-containing protein n=1 Tax=Coemansia reversa (strain ATCC 12441 / NRRL 1564) TaxID=763665 RepID=A0A2G5B4L7_COERN|nr:ARM repeat-containing protein [Coemansia reversa NRRL 1564]|eukprot:PIA13945.1 ARM repeat-containing protein [Coemansia reversa NRRL 1564]
MDPQFLHGLEELLQKLAFADDTSTIQTVTATLSQKFYTDATCIPALLTVAKDNQQWQIRQLATVELRKRIPKFWEDIDDAAQQQMRDTILKVIVDEENSLARHGMARVISSIAKSDIPNQKWGDLIQFLYGCCQNANAAHREIGIYVLDSLFETIAEALTTHMQHLFELFAVLVNDPESLVVQVTTVEALGKLADFIDPTDRAAVTTFQGLVPSMVQVLQKCLACGDEDSASRCYEVFNGMLILETPLLHRHFGEMIEFSINVGSNVELDENLRIMALNFLVWTTTYKRGRLQKLKIVKPLIEKVMPITAQDDPDDDDEDSPSRVALRVLNVLSTSFPPQQVIPTVISHVLQYMQSPDPGFRKGAMLSLAIVIEGSVDYIRPQVSDIVTLICAGLSDSDMLVRRASCMALGCIADELDEEVSEHHEKLMPLIFSMTSDSNTTIVKYATNALDCILESMGDVIQGYLPQLVERLFALLCWGPAEVKPIALSAIGSTAHSSGAAFEPYFAETISQIKQAMALTGDEDALALRGVATDTISTIAEAAGKDAFRPHLDDTMQLALQGMEIESATLRESAYCYFGVMSRVFNDEFAKYLSYIAPQILQTLRMDEESPFELDAGDDSEMVDDEDGMPFNINTAISDEKEVAADAVGQIFASTTTAFLPYVEEISKELLQLLDHYSDTARKAATVALFTFIRTFSKIASPEPWKAGAPLRVPIDDHTSAMIKLVLPAVLAMWEEEDDKMVVTQLCTELRLIMRDVGPAVTIDYAEEISKRLLEIFEKKAPCQTIDFEDEDDALDEDEMAELDSLLICAAADCVAEFADVFGDAFEPIMDTFLPHIANYAKPAVAVSERAMAVGCLAEISKNMGPGITKYAEELFPIFMRALQDEHAELCSNAAFGVGAFIESATVDASAYFSEVLKALYPLFKLEDNSNNVKDNAAGCVARLILENADAVPLADVLPVWISALPIRGDHLEDIPVYDAVCHLFKNKRAEVEPFQSALEPVLKQALADPDTMLSDESREFLAMLTGGN